MKIAWRCLLFLILLTGVIYPLFITGLAELLMREKARGSLVKNPHNQFIGSSLIAQKFEQERYFWSRPSACNYHTLPSEGSNLGPTSQLLKQTLLEREKHFSEKEIPSELLFASASGLDPHLSPKTAIFQIPRIAAARHIDPDQIKQLIHTLTEERGWGFLGEPRVNVLKLNLKLDELE